MKIKDCKLNHIINPVGYFLRSTTFSWIAEGTEIEVYRLVIRKKEGAIIADTGWDKLNPLATKVEICLEPRTIYQWSVSAKNSSGEEVNSPIQTFETGKMEEPWSGKWISCNNEIKRHPIFRKQIEISTEKKLKSARLYICGLGLYEAYLNGEKIGDAYLTPGFCSYNNWVQVQTYDITENFQKNINSQKGINKLSVLIGDGWYRSRISFESPESEFYGNDYRLLAEVHIQYEDGTEEIIGTDESWEVTRSNIVFSGIYDGEIQDDTLEAIPCEKAIIASPLKAKLTDNLSLPVRLKETFEAVLVPNSAEETLLDIGQNLAGIFTLKVKAAKGQKVRLQFGEVLQEGKFYRDNLRTAKAEYVYISDGKEHILRPHFTYYGFRYVKIEGITEFRLKDFKAYAIYTDMPMRGKLKTGNPKINQLLSNVSWGMKSNFVDIPTDCPQRDERMGWTGDTQVFSETACFFADTYAFYRKYLYDMEQEQSQHKGCVPDIVPAVATEVKGSSVWGDATCILPWNLYLYYGDDSILWEHYNSMKAWLSYIKKIDGDNHGWRRQKHYGDWLALDCPYKGVSQTRGGTDEGFISDIYYYKSALITAKTAKILGKEKEAKKYQHLAEKIYQELLAEYYSPNGRCCINTQTAALLTLQENISNPQKAIEQLITLLENNEDKLTTGFVGTPMLCQVLADQGYEKLADKILLNEEYPGWLYAVNLGATTIWERWNSLDEQGKISSTGMNSLNHYSYGAIASFIWKSLAGLQVVEEEPGFRRVEIKPHVNWKIRSINAVYPSPAGEYSISWDLPDKQHIYLQIVIPDRCKAKIILPLDKKKRVIFLHSDSAIYESPQYLEKEENVIDLQSNQFDLLYEASEELTKAHSVHETLQNLIRNSECKKILEEELPNLDWMLGFTRPYPLSETLHNLRCEPEKIKQINKKLEVVFD